MGPQQAKYASEVQTQAGHDLVEMRMHFPWLYEPQLVDVSDVVAELEKQYGKAIASAYEGAHVKGVWRAVPQYHGMFVAAYREDLFKKAGLKVPDTWEDLYTVGKELKKMGNPVGIPISQNYDSISTAGPVLWSFGGMEVDKDGKTVQDQLARHRADDRVVQEDVPRLHGARGAVLVGRQQQRVAPAGQGGLDPQPGRRLHRGQAAEARHRRRHQPPPEPGRARAGATRRTRRGTSASGSSPRTSTPAKEWIRYLLGKREVYDEYIMSGDAFNLPVYDEAPGPPGAPDRSQVRRAQG